MTQPREASNVEYFGRAYSVTQIPPPWRETRRAQQQVSARRRPPLDVRLPETGFLRLPEVLALFPISRSRWWAGITEGKYPAAIKLGANTTAWRAEDIRQLIQQYGSTRST
ncbi:MAG TPA: AlpA family phage regulatory protein [Burkholderiales bacterium]|nr:AlpA family phage regulatory protein [Burkholderiales bacterium]